MLIHIAKQANHRLFCTIAILPTLNTHSHKEIIRVKFQNKCSSKHSLLATLLFSSSKDIFVHG